MNLNLFDGGFYLPQLLMGGLALVLNVLVIGVVIWLVFILVKRSNAGGRATTSPALAVLEERYARGEMTREEFLERRSVLVGSQEAP
jgi:uncharacterized membrane protein